MTIIHIIIDILCIGVFLFSLRGAINIWRQYGWIRKYLAYNVMLLVLAIFALSSALICGYDLLQRLMTHPFRRVGVYQPKPKKNGWLITFMSLTIIVSSVTNLTQCSMLIDKRQAIKDQAETIRIQRDAIRTFGELIRSRTPANFNYKPTKTS